MKNYSFIIYLLIFCFGWSAYGQQEEPIGKKYLILYMGIKQNEVLSHLPPDAEFYGDFKSIVDAELDRERKTLHFTPKKPGLATLSMHDRKGQKLFEYRIDVRKSQLTKVVREVRGLLHDIEGISIKIVNDKVIVDGNVLLPHDLNRIFGVIKQYDGQVASLVEINPIAQKRIADIIERDINNPDIEVRAINGKFILKGIANSDTERKQAEIIAKMYVPAPVINEAEAQGKIKKRKEEVVINLLSIRPPPQSAPPKIIQLVVHYVELSKKYLRSSAFRWSPALVDNTEVAFTKDTTQNSDGIIAEISGVISNLLPKLNSAKQHGFARVLKSTSVTTKEGQPGKVETVQRIPILVPQPGVAAGGFTNDFAEVRVASEITPTITNPRSDIIELKMSFTVGTLLGITDRGPQTAQNNVNTMVDVRSGQSAAVGGLIANDSGTDYNPEANQDALFNLYSEKGFRRNKSQFVVFVTPIIKPSASAGSEKIKSKFRLQE